MSRSYYDVLGVEPDATSEEIRDAYRREAKRLHPDHYQGEDGSGPFRAVHEAYEVLSDPGRRRAYDAERRERRAVTPQRRAGGGARAWGRGRPEPLIPDAPSWSSPLGASPLGASPYDYPAYETYDDGFGDWFGLTGRLLSSLLDGGRAPRVIDLDVRLSRGLARDGGPVRLEVPLQVRCPACDGTGYEFVFACPHCGGRGRVVRRVPLELELPPGLSTGDTVRVSLDGAGMQPVMLRLHCYV